MFAKLIGSDKEITSHYAFVMATGSSNTTWAKASFKQIIVLTQANLKARYRNTVAGFIWVILNPLIMFGVQSFIFAQVLNLQITNYYVFLLSGLLPWIFISQNIDMCSTIFVVNGHLLKSYSVHPLVYFSAQILDNALNFLAAFLLILFPFVVFMPDVSRLLLLPIPIFFLILSSYSLAWLLATFHIFYRDTKYVVGFALSIFYFLTPVFYLHQFVPEKFRWIIWFNPFHYIINPFRSLIYQFDLGMFVKDCALAALVSLLAFACAIIYWRRKRNEIYFSI